MGRREDNDALRDLTELVDLMPELEDRLRLLLKRNRFDSGQKIHRRGEFAEMEGTQTTHYNDPTGETAIYCDDWKTDSVFKTIRAMAASLHKWLEMAKWMQDLSSTDVVKRAEKTVPNCVACQEPCNGKVRAGFDDKCYMRYMRIPGSQRDRHAFIAMVQREQQQKHAQSAEKAAV